VSVLDSSAMLAYLHGETGGELVRDVLADPDRDVAVYAHAVNLCEVFYDTLKAYGPTVAESVIANLKADGVEERNDMDAAFWRDVATLIATQRASGGHLALGDAFGLALARREGGDFYTADRHELEAVAKAGLCAVTFIR
jgi:PIN domain nuclease of toxin-antitoxin system